MKRAVCLLSGGLDSATSLYAARYEGYAPAALTISYGQRHNKEIQCAKAIAHELGIKHWVISSPLPWGGSALLDRSMPLPSGRNEKQMAKDIPATYVPARNSVFLALAASLAETLDARAIFIGANALDYSGYPDCRPAYFKAAEKWLGLGTKAGVSGKKTKIVAPLLKMSKKEIVKFAVKLGVPLKMTWSCYEGGKRPCGECDSCLLRAKGFREAKVKDPLV